MKKILKIAGIALAVLIVFLIVRNVVIKLSHTGSRSRSIMYAVGTEVLKKERVQRILSFTGTVEGDPQIKVYPQVSGKFWGNEVQEGSRVGKDAVLAYINRDIVGMNYQLAPVTAPVAGVVKKLYYADRGANVSMNQPIAEITDPRNIKVILSTGEADLARIKSGMLCRIVSVQDESVFLNGSVVSVTPFVDSDTLAGSAIVKARNPSRTLMIGATVDVAIVVGQAEMFMAPQEAILSKLDKTFVFLDDNGIARQTEITQGYVQGDRVEIKGGFKEGDVLVTLGAFKLSEGAKIRTGDADIAGPGNAGPAGAGKKKVKSPKAKDGAPVKKEGKRK